MPHEVRNNLSPHDENAYWTWLESNCLFHVYFVKITPSGDWANLSALGFTSYHENVTFATHSGVVFKPVAGLDPSASETALSQSPNLEVGSVFNAGEIEEADLIAGKWNNAKIEYWRMNGDDFKMGEEVLFTGVLAHFTDFQDYFKAELIGLSDVLNTNMVDFTSRICRAVGTFTKYPGECKFSAATVQGFQAQRILTVSTVTDRTGIKFTRSADNVPDDFYVNGRAECVTGNNEGISREIQVGTGVGSGTVDIVLKRGFPLPVAVADTFELTVGCNGTLKRCQTLGNVINRDAEDWIPGFEKAAKVPPLPA